MQRRIQAYLKIVKVERQGKNLFSGLTKTHPILYKDTTKSNILEEIYKLFSKQAVTYQLLACYYHVITPGITSTITTDIASTIIPAITSTITTDIASTITPGIASTINPGITSTFNPYIASTITPVNI